MRRQKVHLARSKDIVVDTDKDNNDTIMPNQYAKVKNTVKGEEFFPDNKGQNYDFVDESVE
jgi:hypothetical protein